MSKVIVDELRRLAKLYFTSDDNSLVYAADLLEEKRTALGTILHYHVDIRRGGRSGKLDEFAVSEHTIVAENESFIVVDNAYFTRVRKKASDYDTSIDKESISLSTADSYWGNRISYSLYTTRKVRASTIKRHIEAEIKKKFGFFMDGVDLDCIKDEK